MKLTLIWRALLVLALGSTTFIAASDAGAIDSGGVGPAPAEIGLATFEGNTIDLKQGWGDAQACYIAENLAAMCFRTEQEMDALLGIDVMTLGDYPSNANGYAYCGYNLKLYYGSYYRTPVMYLAARGTWTTLAWFGADNVTSSYKMGSCQAVFRSGSYGGGSTYPGSTSPWAMRTTMGWYWDNALSSVYIY